MKRKERDRLHFSKKRRRKKRKKGLRLLLEMEIFLLSTNNSLCQRMLKIIISFLMSDKRLIIKNLF